MNKKNWKQTILDPRRIHGVTVRQRTYAAIREHFLEKQFLEVETPLLVTSPGMEPHIRPWELKTNHHDMTTIDYRVFLHTSPEFAMKKLLCGGLENIFQLCKVFRFEPLSPSHHPEFTMLEWYRAQASLETLMKDTETLMEFLAEKICGSSEFKYEDHKVSFKTPFPRLKVNSLFKEYVGIDLAKNLESPALARQCRRLGLQADDSENWDDLYFKIWLNLIEPTLPKDKAFFVTHYPASQAALSKVQNDSDGVPWALRFELYAAGLELGNAFEELTDPIEQKNRFEKDMLLREKTYGPDFPTTPIDESFIRALKEGLPPCSGIAVGVDRLIMLLANEQDINYTVWLVPFTPKE